MNSAGTRELQILTEVREMTWADWAICGETDPEAYFVEKGGSTLPAKRVCAGCPVQQECLDYALDHEEQHGVWGGLSARERRDITRARKREAA
jgi:WhiB family transcriptional regulator, redox-sensing transcriptional regulator